MGKQTKPSSRRSRSDPRLKESTPEIDPRPTMKVAALALVTLALTLALTLVAAADLCIYEPCAPGEDGTYALPDLPYPYDSLEPSIDNKTMGFHHDVHFKGYTTKMNKALAEMPQADGTIEERMTSVDVSNSDPSSIFFLNNGGGYLNHKMYFATMGRRLPYQPGRPARRQDRRGLWQLPEHDRGAHGCGQVRLRIGMGLPGSRSRHRGPLHPRPAKPELPLLAEPRPPPRR